MVIVVTLSPTTLEGVPTNVADQDGVAPANATDGSTVRPEMAIAIDRLRTTTLDQRDCMIPAFYHNAYANW